MNRIILIINSKRKLKRDAKQFISLVDSLEEYVIIKHFTMHQKDATETLREVLKDNDIVIGIGGDGTCNEVVNGILKTSKVNIRFGIVPNGTGNDFLKMCKPFDSHRFLNRIKKNDFNLIDIGRLMTNESTFYFLNIADVGLGGKVIDIMNKQRKAKIGGKFSYASAIIRGFMSFKKPILSIQSEDINYEGKVMIFAACNGAVFGHGLVINPDANLTNGQINFTLIGDVTLFDYVKNLGKLKKGKKINHPKISYHSSKELEIKVIEGKLFGETDGELIKVDNCNISAIANKLQLINELN